MMCFVSYLSHFLNPFEKLYVILVLIICILKTEKKLFYLFYFSHNNFLNTYCLFCYNTHVLK